MIRPMIQTWAPLLIALTALTACGKPADEAGAVDGKKKVVATTTMIEDLARELSGGDIQVDGIMKPGGDPHLYTPTPADATLIARADLVLTNGLKLEGWIDDLVRNAGGGASIKEISGGVEALKDPLKTNYPDPHIWHDVKRWMIVTRNTADALAALSPEHAGAIKAREAAYLDKLAALDKEVQRQIDLIPREQRVLITSHDAFQYYARSYGVEVVAVQGLSTQSEAGAQDVARVVDVIRARKIPAVFIETSVNPKLIEQISRETGVSIGGTLFSDSLGDTGAPGGTYVGMIEENTRLIVKALGGPGDPSATRKDTADKAN